MTALKQNVPRTQSLSEAHGKAHFPYATLQRWFRHIASLVHGDAAGPGTASVSDSLAASPGRTAALAGVEIAGESGVAAGAGSPGRQAARTSAITNAEGPVGPHATRATFRIFGAVRVPFSGRMRKRKIRRAAL